MSEEGQSARLAILWAEEARGNLRAIDRKTALEILHCVDRYLATRSGDVKGSSLHCSAFGCDAATTGSSSIRVEKKPFRQPAFVTAGRRIGDCNAVAAGLVLLYAI